MFLVNSGKEFNSQNFSSADNFRHMVSHNIQFICVRMQLPKVQVYYMIVVEGTFHNYVNIYGILKLRTQLVCDLPSENQPSLHLVVFQEILHIQVQKPDLSLVLCLRVKH